MKNVAFVMGLVLVALGAAFFLAPSGVVRIVPTLLTPGAFSVAALVRVALGLLLIGVASASRAPRALRVIGYLIVVAGIGSAVMGFLAMERARALVEWWMVRGVLVHVTGIPIMALGAFIAYACAPGRRATDESR